MFLAEHCWCDLRWCVQAGVVLGAVAADCSLSDWNSCVGRRLCRANSQLLHLHFIAVVRLCWYISLVNRHCKS